MGDTVSELAQKLRPYWLRDTNSSIGLLSSGGAATMVAHALNGPYHTGQLAETQAAWAATKSELAAHAALPDAHHAQVHALVGSDHTASGLTAGYVVRASGATSFAWAQLQHADLGGVTANQHHNQVHSVSGTDHTITGSKWALVGATADNTLGLITPSAAPGAAEAILKSTSAGLLTLPLFAATTKVTSPLIDATANLSIQPTGDLILDPGDSSVLPGGSVQDDLGYYNRKWRSLYAAELYVETLVAQDVLATIGGRIMVAPTTKLIADLSAGASTMDVQHNNLNNGSFAMMMTAPDGIAQFEVVKVTSSATAITGGYRYSITRNQDGSGTNAWVTGDAVVNLGSAAGHGYIDLTSTTTVHNHLGPTIAIYSRTGTAAWTDVKPVTALGNLHSFVDYSTDEFGIAVGNDLTLQPNTGFKGLTADRTNGLRMFNTAIQLYNGGTQTVQIGAAGNDIWMGPSSADKRLIWDGSLLTVTGKLYVADASRLDGAVTLGTSGGIYQGSGSFASPTTGLKLWNDSGIGRIGGYNAGTIQWYANTDGMLYAGGGNAWMNATGIGLNAAAGKFTGSTLSWWVGGTRFLSIGMNVDLGSPVSAFFETLSAGYPLYIAASALYMNSNTVWHAGNDGTGTGMDADLLDGSHASAFALLSGATFTGAIRATGISVGVAAESGFIAKMAAAGDHTRLKVGNGEDKYSQLTLSGNSGDWNFQRADSAASNRFAIAWGATEHVAIKTDGKMGVKTSDPQRALHVAGTILVDGDEGGYAGTIGFTDVSNTAARSSGVGTIKFADTTHRDCVGFIKIYVGTDARYIPIFAAG